MPLKKGSSSAALRYNIKELESSGRSHEQSVAIALSVSGKKKKQKK